MLQKFWMLSLTFARPGCMMSNGFNRNLPESRIHEGNPKDYRGRTRAHPDARGAAPLPLPYRRGDQEWL